MSEWLRPKSLRQRGVVHGLLKIYWHAYCQSFQVRSYMVALSAAICTRSLCVSIKLEYNPDYCVDNSDRIKQSAPPRKVWSRVDLDCVSIGPELGVRLP